MTTDIEVKTETTMRVDPETLALIFWHMSDSEQAEFFHHLADVVETHNPEAYGRGEMQWCCMGQAVRRHSQQAWEMFLAFSAFAYDYWPQKKA